MSLHTFNITEQKKKKKSKQNSTDKDIEYSF